MLRAAIDINGTPIGLLEVCNQSATAQVSDYDYRFGRRDPASGEWTFTGWSVVRGHARADGAWALIAQVLATAAEGHDESSRWAGGEQGPTG